MTAASASTDIRRFFLGAALALMGWQALTYYTHFILSSIPFLGRLLYSSQDWAVLAAMTAALLVGSRIKWPTGGGMVAPLSSGRLLLALAVFVVLTLIGRQLLFGGYALSRDEQMAEFAGQYLAMGQLGLAIPPEWQGYARALVPIFYSSYGADQVWSSAYLPVYSLFRALFQHLGSAALAGPMLTVLGLFCLWRIAVRLFPDRPDAIWVVMLMALSSAQLMVTAMSSYAASGHFGLDMLWLWLLLRADRKSHVAAAFVMLLSAGLHQWHFAILFMAPFILWLGLQRRWGAFLFHGIVMIAVVLFWVRGWPFILEMVNGAPPPSAPPPRASVTQKVLRLFQRLDDLQPILSAARFIAWNNLLLVPLAGLALVTLWRTRLAALQGRDLLLPLVLSCGVALLFMLDQKNGWGYRYFHHLIGAYCLLAGYGWLRLSGSAPRLTLRPIWASVAFSAVVMLFLMAQAHRFVLPYAKAYEAVSSSDAELVFVDWRGGLYGQDLVRFEGSGLGQPILIDMYQLDTAKVDDLCGRYDVAVYDHRSFLPLGIPGRGISDDDPVNALRKHMALIGCGRPVVPRRP